MWTEHAIDILNRVNSEKNVNWDTECERDILAWFVMDNTDPAAFEAHCRQIADNDLDGLNFEDDDEEVEQNNYFRERLSEGESM